MVEEDRFIRQYGETLATRPSYKAKLLSLLQSEVYSFTGLQVIVLVFTIADKIQMPRKHKKSSFRGVSSRNIKKESEVQEKLASERKITEMESVALPSSQSEEMNSSVDILSSSTCKSRLFASLADNNEQVEIPTADIAKGYCLIDMEYSLKL